MAKSFNAVKISVSGRNLKRKKERKSKLKPGKLWGSHNNKLEEVQTALVLWSFSVWNRLVFCWLCWSICVITTQPEVLANLSRRSKQDKQENPVNLLSTEAITVGYK